MVSFKSIASSHSRVKCASASSGLTSTIGRGGRVLASFRWIFRLNASGTGVPRPKDSFSAGSWFKQDAKCSVDLVSMTPISCSTAARKSRRKMSLHWIASLNFLSILACWSIQETASSMSFWKCSMSKGVRRLRLYSWVTKSSSWKALDINKYSTSHQPQSSTPRPLARGQSHRP